MQARAVSTSGGEVNVALRNWTRDHTSELTVIIHLRYSPAAAAKYHTRVLAAFPAFQMAPDYHADVQPAKILRVSMPRRAVCHASQHAWSDDDEDEEDDDEEDDEDEEEGAGGSGSSSGSTSASDTPALIQKVQRKRSRPAPAARLKAAARAAQKSLEEGGVFDLQYGVTAAASMLSRLEWTLPAVGAASAEMCAVLSDDELHN